MSLGYVFSLEFAVGFLSVRDEHIVCGLHVEDGAAGDGDNEFSLNWVQDWRQLPPSEMVTAMP